MGRGDRGIARVRGAHTTGNVAQGSLSSPAAFPSRRGFGGAIKVVMVSSQARFEKQDYPMCGAERLAPLEEPQGRRAGPALLLRVAPTWHLMSATVKKPEPATDGTR